MSLLFYKNYFTNQYISNLGRARGSGYSKLIMFIMSLYGTYYVMDECSIMKYQTAQFCRFTIWIYNEIVFIHVRF